MPRSPERRSRSPDRHRQTSTRRDSRDTDRHRRNSRSRSRSPRPRNDVDPSRQSKKPHASSGFRWKEKKGKEQDRGASERDAADGKGRLERGYRRREGDDREKVERKQRDDSPVNALATAPAITKPDTTITTTASASDSGVADKFGTSSKFSSRTRARDSTKHTGGTEVGAPAANTSKPTAASSTTFPPTSAMAAASPASAPSHEAMIIVHVNDRLGTKAAIPCLASDSVKLFKAQVAARIGRQPHEIMLKRQGERPFKDALSLEDYGVSGGCQIDLEIDTGD